MLIVINKIYKEIYLQIERYKELREKFSIFDEYYNIKGISKNIINGQKVKPLKDELNNLNHNLKWLLFVSKLKLNVYGLSEERNDEFDYAINILNTIDEVNNYNDYKENYLQNQSTNEQENPYYQFNK